MEFGDCTRVYKGHEHTVGCIYVDKGLGKNLVNIKMNHETY